MSAYTKAGVDIDKGQAIATYLGMKDYGSTFRAGSEQIVLSTDGVGTKLLVAEAQNKFDTVGIDLVAMCVNDILCKFARPVSFLDYYATGKLDLNKSKEILDGILKGCELAGCTLAGGETAEMPGVYEGTKFDLAGFVAGIVIDQSKNTIVESGDYLIGIPSSGPHSNGFSLLRKVMPLAEIPLTPTRIYTKEILENYQLITNCAHITGGGLIKNIPRMLGGLDFELYPLEANLTGWWEDLYDKCEIGLEEFFTVFNGGYGMVLAVAPDNTKDILHSISDSKIIGKVK